VRLIALMQRSAAQARLVLLGGTLIFFVFQVLLIAHAAEIERSAGFGRIADLVPQFLQRGLGAQALLLATFKGSVSFGYFHPVIVCAVSLIAIYIATEPAHEVETGLVDLVLARSVPRHRILTRSLLLAIIVVVALTILMLCGTYVGLRILAPEFAWPPFGLLALLGLHLVAVACCCASIGLLAAVSSKRWTTAFTIGAAVVIVGYLVDFLAIGWPPARVLAWAFPFNYYPALLIIGGTAHTGVDLAVLFGATAALTALSYWQFQRRDI
jgi:ABC-type transport system involved in multi-copper enzyme maturation permease subunit